MGNNYTYPDRSDAVTVAFLKNETSWEEDERRVLKFAMSFLHKGKVFVDAGTGFGRLIPFFAPYFEKVIAIDPDSERLEKAKQSIALESFSNKVEFLHSQTEEPDLVIQADAILSSHVIQHVSTAAVPKILRKMQSMLKAKGTLILTTNNSPFEDDRYMQSHVRDGESIEEEISQNEFEGLIGGVNGKIPVHQFSSRALGNLITQAGFLILARRPFHFNAKYPRGMDVLIVAIKND